MVMETFTFHDILISVIVFGLSVLIVLSKPLHQALTSDSMDKIQGIHKTPVPRIGGTAVVAGVGIGFWLSQGASITTGWLLFGSAVPVFIFGLAEDLRCSVSPFIRLCAAIASGVFAVLFLDVWLSEIRLPFFDDLMKLAPIGICLTVFASTTMVHAYNLSDGLNGLCSGFAIIALFTLHALAVKVGDPEVALLARTTMCAAIGFWFLNYFSGQVFLGDGGAYFFGHMVAWISILLSARHPEISPWALFLNTLVPITDTILTILRRLRDRKSLDAPDRQHLHHLVFDFLSRGYLSRCTLGQQNSAATLLILMLASGCSLTAHYYFGATNLLVGFCIAYVVMIGVTTHKLKSFLVDASKQKLEKS